MHVNELVQPNKSFLKGLENEVTKIFADAIYENGYCEYSSREIAKTILETALQKSSLEGNATIPDSDTVFYRLKNSRLTEETILSMLYKSRPQSHEPIIVLLDVHDDMYCGRKYDRHGNKIMVVGTKPKEGSHQAFKYLTAKRPHGEVVYTFPLFNGSVIESSIKIIEELQRSYTICYVIGDGAFPSSLLIDYLKANKIHFVFRYPSTSKLRCTNMPYNVLKTYSTTYKAPYKGRLGTIPVDFYICKYRGEIKEDAKKKDFYIISDLKLSARKLRKFLKCRWDIESGFREIERLTIRTTTKSYLFRYFFHVFACIIYNFWMDLRNSIDIRMRDMVLLILQIEPARVFRILEKRMKYILRGKQLWPAQ